MIIVLHYKIQKYFRVKKNITALFCVATARNKNGGLVCTRPPFNLLINNCFIVLQLI